MPSWLEPALAIPEAPTLVQSVALFNLGTLINDQSSRTYGRGAGTKIEIPVTGAFIEMRDGEHILFDTGMMPHGCDAHRNLSTSRFRDMIARYEPEDDIRRRLGELGRTPDDVKMVINSHFHWDHAGGNQLFP